MEPSNYLYHRVPMSDSGSLSHRNLSHSNPYIDPSLTRAIVPEPTSARSTSGNPSFRRRGTSEVSVAATSPFPSQDFSAISVAGQFSDADSGDSTEETQQSKLKRQRVANDDPLTRDTTLYQGDSTSEVMAMGMMDLNSPSQPNHGKSTPNFSSAALDSGAHHSRRVTQAQGQLPFSVRRLATLAGIPESSQAIIQSTLPPLKRASTHNNIPSSLTSDRRPSTGLERHRSPANVQSRAASVLPSHNHRALGASANQASPRASPQVSERLPSEISVMADQPSRGYQEPNGLHQQIGTSCPESTGNNHQNPVSCVPTSVVSPSDNAPLSPRTYDQPCQVLEPTGRTESTSPDIEPNISAPRFEQCDTELDGFSIPEPGTYSLPADQAARDECFARFYDSSNHPEPIQNTSVTSEIHMAPVDQGPSCSAQDRIDPTENPTENPTDNTDEEPTPSEVTIRPKRNKKAGKSKKKAQPKNDQVDDSEPEVELVRPPPTINGKVSHGRKVPVGYVKRTPNSFILFRSHVVKQKILPPCVQKNSRQISRVVSGLWAGLSTDDLLTWHVLSEDLKAAAQARNPNHKNPTVRRKEIIRRKRSGQRPGETLDQWAEREKAEALAVANAMLDSQGQPLDADTLYELDGISLSEQELCGSSRSRKGSRQANQAANRPEFRAPPSLNVVPEGAESTSSTSPRLDHPDMLPSTLESVEEEPSNSLTTSTNTVTGKTTKRAKRGTKSPANQDGQGKKPSPKPRTSKRASKAAISQEETGREAAAAPTTESTPCLTSDGTPNGMELSDFPDILNSLPDQMGSSTFPDSYSQDVFQSLGVSTSGHCETTLAASSSTQISSSLAIDPSVFTMTSVPIETGTSEPSGLYWIRHDPTPILPHQPNSNFAGASDSMMPVQDNTIFPHQPDSNFAGASDSMMPMQDDMIFPHQPTSNFAGASDSMMPVQDERIIPGSTFDQQNQLSGVVDLYHLLASGQLPANGFLGHPYGHGALYPHDGNSHDENALNFNSFHSAGISTGEGTSSLIPSQTLNSYDILQLPTDSGNQDNWTWQTAAHSSV